MCLDSLCDCCHYGQCLQFVEMCLNSVLNYRISFLGYDYLLGLQGPGPRAFGAFRGPRPTAFRAFRV